MSNLIQRLMAQANCEANEVADLLNEAAEALAERQGEAVAWLDEEMDNAYTAKELDGGASDGLVALYTHRAPARQPLSVQEVEMILAQHNYEIHGDRARYIVRRTEVAHGIGGEKP